jgi:hypothetical protein
MNILKFTRRRLLGIVGLCSAWVSSEGFSRKCNAFAAPEVQIIPFPQTSAEAAAGITPVDFRYAPGVVDRYGKNAAPGKTDMSSAVQAAAEANSGTISFLESTYLFSDVMVRSPTVIQGRGFGSTLVARIDTIGSSRYSRNLFSCTVKIERLAFKDVTLDGGCDNPSGGHAHEVALLKITAASTVSFENVKLTRYCGGWDGVVKPVSSCFFQAITVQNAGRVVFRNCLLTNNHYEQVSIWSSPSSESEILIDSCSELNDGRPNSHTAFDVSGGHVTVTNNLFRNTGATSTLNIQVPKSARVANNVFLDMQVGAAAQINVGQSTFPGNDNVVIEHNYCRNANSAAIEIGPGSNITIRGNIIDTPTNYGVQITGGVDDFEMFNALFPEWPAGNTSISKALIISGNTINGVSNTASLSRAIFLHTVARGSGWWFRNVLITGNTVSALAPPHNTFCGLWIDDIEDGEISGNILQYTQNAMYFGGAVQNLRIVSNTLTSVAPINQNDVVFFGAYASANVLIERNKFTNFPVGPTYNILLGHDYTIAGLNVLDNVGLHPVLPVFSANSVRVVQRQSREFTGKEYPVDGDWGINDIAKNVAIPGSQAHYICTIAGSFGPAITCTSSGRMGDCFFNCSAISQLHVGQHFAIAGAGPASEDLKCTCVYITGKVFYVDQTIPTTVSGASMALVHPVFVNAVDRS